MNQTATTAAIVTRSALPELLSAKHIQSMGVSRSMAYALLNKEGLSVSSRASWLTLSLPSSMVT